jgi:hypothetical protein
VAPAHRRLGAARDRADARRRRGGRSARGRQRRDDAPVRIGRRLGGREQLLPEGLLLRVVQRAEPEREALGRRLADRIGEQHERLLEALDVDLQRVGRAVDRRALELEVRDLVRDGDERQVSPVAPIGAARGDDRERRG